MALNSELQEVDLSGTVIWQMCGRGSKQRFGAATCAGCNITIVGTHHDFAVLPNGHVVVIASTERDVAGTTVTGDVLIDLDQNHNPVWLWNEFDHLNVNRRPFKYPDWTHTNADPLFHRRWQPARVHTPPELAHKGGLRKWLRVRRYSVAAGLSGRFHPRRRKRSHRLVLRSARSFVHYAEYLRNFFADSF